MTIHIVTPAEACHRCKADQFAFETTAELESLTRWIGQDRALEAVDFATGIHHDGYNLFVIGPEGSGRHSITKSFIDEKASALSTPSDRCYVHHFLQPHQPAVLEFAPGAGKIFKKEMHDLIDMLKTTLPAVMEGEDYRTRSKAIKDLTQQKIDRLYREVEIKAEQESISVVKNDQGLIFAPMDGNGKPIETKDFLKLPDNVRKNIEKKIDKFQAELQQAIHEISILKREAEEKSRKLKKETAGLAVSHLIDTLKFKYRDNEKVVDYLIDVEENITERVDDFLYNQNSQEKSILSLVTARPTFEQYEVNVLVANEAQGAPVVYEDMPTYQNLHGRIEHQAMMGMLTTNFTLIKPGSLHRANGGYLIIDAHRLLMQPFAYEGLKRTLRARKIHIEPVERLMGLMSTVVLEPEPIPLNVKIVLIGEPLLYYLLKEYDPEFSSLFKVQADFEHDMERSVESLQAYSALLAGLAREHGLRPLHRSAVGRVIEHAARRAEDRDKLSLHVGDFADLIKEADYFAGKHEAETIMARDVEEALAAAERRGARIRDRMYEAIQQGIHHVETRGTRMGQVNGITVIGLGSDSFGCPSRITALTRAGKGDIVDIEREVELGGPIHSKGVMILSSYLHARYAREIPVGLQASLVFEQSYGGVEGDSASCAELCALLSSLAETPIDQAIAITGSVSQQGEVQAIGGVNEKIEGFFDICSQRGLSEGQGVIIPAANIRHLMLKKEVVDAIEAGKFTVYGVNHVDEAVELLTGLPAGERGEDGDFPENSLNGRVEATLIRYAKDIQTFENSGSGDQDGGEFSEPAG